MPVLVDTSVWINHFRRPNPDLVALLAAKEVVRHTVVVGELAVGNLADREDTLSELGDLPALAEVQPRYALGYIARHRLYGLGLSWGDAQLLAAADLSGIPIWTFDQRLQQQAQAMNVSWTP